MSCKNNIWKECTNGIISFCVLIMFLVVILIYLMLPAKISNDDQKKIECMTEKCVRSAAAIMNLIDKNVDPCEDFYKFVCGKFINNTVIPGEKTVVKTFTLVNNKIKSRLKNLLDQPTNLNDSKTLTLLKTAYKSCLNTSELETEALPFIKKIFKELGGWPVIDPNWNERKFDWKNTLFRLRRMGLHFNLFVTIFIDTDLKNSSQRILTITQPYISDYQVLNKGINHSDTQAYYNYMVNIATHFGAQELPASVEMKEVLEFEINLNKILEPYTGSHNVSSVYNLRTIKQLQENIPTIPWLQVINNFLAPTEMLSSKNVINVAFPKFLTKLEDLLINTNKRVLANYMLWHIVKKSVLHLPRRFKDEAEKYFRRIRGVTRLESRWEQCIKEMDKLNVAMSSIYIQHFFNQEDKEKVTEIASYIKEAFVDVLLQSKWMDDNTKTRALLKVDTMKIFIFPEELLEEDEVEDYYRELVLNRSHYLKLGLNISSFFHKKRVKRLRETVIKQDWTSRDYARSYYPNGFYNQRVNAIELMAALMHDHYFDSGRPQCMNFGSIGEIIGHEITHGFDIEGKQFDENGNLANWWAPETLETFTKKSECFVRQYSSVTLPEIRMNVNGGNTVDENIADNGGFKVAYQGYLKWRRKNEDLVLPGVPYTPKQIFWISVASDQCCVYKKEALKRMVASGRHAPESARVLLPLMNSEDFAEDFSCSVGSRMNPEEKCRLW